MGHHADTKTEVLAGVVERVVLVGQPKAVAIAVKNASDRRRWSKL